MRLWWRKKNVPTSSESKLDSGTSKSTAKPFALDRQSLSVEPIDLPGGGKKYDTSQIYNPDSEVKPIKVPKTKLEQKNIDLDQNISDISKRWNETEGVLKQQQLELTNFENQINDPSIPQDVKNILIPEYNSLLENSKKLEEEYNTVKSSAIKLQHAKATLGKIDKVEQELEQKKKSLGTEVYESLKRGSSSLGGMIARSPGFIYDLAAWPQNKLAEIAPNTFGSLNVSHETFAETVGLPDNKVAAFYEAAAKESQENIALKYDKGISEYFANGEIENGFKLLANQVAESVPVSLSLMVGGAAGLTAKASTVGGGIVFGAGKKQELDEQNPDMAESDKTANALSTGLVEGLLEQYGITKLGGVIKNIFQNEGKDVAIDVAKKGFKEVYGPTLNKYLGVHAEEVVGEMATQFTQNAIDKYSGAKPDIDLTDGVMDAGFVGFGSSSVFSAPVIAADIAKIKKQKKKAEKVGAAYSRLEELKETLKSKEETITVPSVTAPPAPVDNTATLEVASPTQPVEPETKEALDNKSKVDYPQTLSSEYFKNEPHTTQEVDDASNELQDKASEMDEGMSELKATLPTETIDATDIVPTQKYVYDKKVDEYSQYPSDELPTLIKSGDKYYIDDGHNRIAADIKSGRPIQAKVYDSSKEDTELPVEAPIPESVTPEAIPPPLPPPSNDKLQTPKQRVRALSKELSESETIPKELREKIKFKGIEGDVFSHEEANTIADNIVNSMSLDHENGEYGILQAVDVAEKELTGSVKAFVYGKAIDFYAKKIDEATTEEEKDRLADIGADITEKFQKNAEEYGRFISAIGKYYQNHPDIIAKREIKKIEALAKSEMGKKKATQEKIDAVLRDLENLKQDTEQKIQAGIEEAIDKIKVKLPTGRRKKADKAIASINSIQNKLRGKSYSDVTGIIAAVDSALTLISKSIDKGIDIIDAIEIGVKHINAKMKGAKWNDTEFRKDILDGLKEDGVSVKRSRGGKAKSVAKIKEKEDSAKSSKSKKINEFGRILSERIPTEPKEKKGAEDRLLKLASELDESEGGSEYGSLANEYIDIKNEEAEQKENDKDVNNFGKLLSERIPTEPKEKKSREDKLKALAKKLDATYNTNEYTEKFNEYIDIKRTEAQELADAKAAKIKQQENDRKLIKFGKLLSKAIPQKGETAKEAEIRKNKELAQLASDLDAINNTTEYSETVDEFLDVTEEEKTAKEISDFGKMFSEKVKTAKNKTTKIQKLKAAAAELDKKLGTTEYSKFVDEYSNMKDSDQVEKEQLAILNKYFPKKKIQSDAQHKKEHQKIIEQYNAGMFEGKTNKDGISFESLFYEKLGIVNPNSPEIKAKLKEFSKQIGKAKEGTVLWREANQEMLNYLANIAYETRFRATLNKVDAMWYANILSSPATHLRNMQFNIINTMLGQPLLMIQKAALKGDFKAASTIYSNLFKGLAKGTVEAGRVMKTSKSSRFDAVLSQPITDRGGKFMKFFAVPGRALKSSDILFTDGAYQTKMSEFARNMVKSENPDWTNDQVNVKVNEMIGNTKERKEAAQVQAEKELEEFYGPDWKEVKDINTIQKIREFELIDESMPESLKGKHEDAVAWAKKTLLTNKPTGIYGRISDWVQEMNNDLWFTKFVVPFINVPLNVAQGIFDRGPIGLIKWATGKEGFGKHATELTKDQKQELLLKAVNYTIAMAALALLNGDDDDDDFVVTGEQTGNYTDNKGITRGGKLEPYSVYVKGKKILSYKTTPWAAVFMPVGYIRDSKIYGEDKGVADKISGTIVSYLLFINEASAMQGVAGMFEAISKAKDVSSETIGASFGKLASGMIPYSGAIKYVTNTVNAATGKADRRPIDWYETIYRDIPFATQAMNIRKDHFGQPIRENFDIPLVPIGDRGLFKEMSEKSKYYKLTSDHKYFPKYSNNRTFYVKGQEVEISKKELDDINVRRGELVKEALDSKNIFISKSEADKMLNAPKGKGPDPSKESQMTTMEYLDGLDNEDFKEQMDKLFKKAEQRTRLEKYGEYLNVSKKDIKKFANMLDAMKIEKEDISEEEINKVKSNKNILEKFKEEGGLGKIEIESY